MSHWYQRDGSPMHFITAKDGSMRETTLRDARKLNLFPSVTTIGKIIAAPGLDRWKKEQALQAGLGFPGLGAAIAMHKDRLADYIAWSVRESESIVKKKAEEGNAIHDALELNFIDPDNIPPQYLAHVDGVNRLLADTFGENRVFQSEQSFVHEDGFGGKIDLESYEGGDEIILDFKSKDFDATKKVADLVWDEHHIQLGGYARGRNRPKARLFNLFVSTTSPGLCLLYEHTREEAEWGIAMFDAARHLWQVQKKYRPTW